MQRKGLFVFFIWVFMQRPPQKETHWKKQGEMNIKELWEYSNKCIMMPAAAAAAAAINVGRQWCG